MFVRMVVERLRREQGDRLNRGSMKNLGLILFLFLMAACTNTKHQNPSANSIKYDIAYGYYSYNLEKLSNKNQNSLKLLFPSIPGLIFGNPTKNNIHVVSIQSSKYFTLELPSHLDGKADYLRTSQLEIEPKDTKILRLGTFYIYPNSTKAMGGGGFIDTKSGNILLLVYFSKPSRISGTLSLSGEHYDHKIKITNAGWHWLEVKKRSPKEYTIAKYTGSYDSIDFMVLSSSSASI